MNKELKAYEEYKKTRLPWVGNIPLLWELLRNKNVMKLRREIVGDQNNKYTLLSLTLNGIIARDMVNAKGKFPRME